MARMLKIPSESAKKNNEDTSFHDFLRVYNWGAPENIFPRQLPTPFSHIQQLNNANDDVIITTKRAGPCQHGRAIATHRQAEVPEARHLHLTVGDVAAKTFLPSFDRAETLQGTFFKTPPPDLQQHRCEHM